MSFPWAKPYEPTHPLMKWMDEKLPIPRLVYNATGPGYPVPRNLNYFWNFGVLAGAALMIQIITGIVLAMHYAANASVALSGTKPPSSHSRTGSPTSGIAEKKPVITCAPQKLIWPQGST